MAIAEIKKITKPIPTTILAAGVSQRMKSYEPRCLLKYNKSTILETQVETLKSVFNCSLSVVVGNNAEKIIKKMSKYSNLRFIENQRYDETNAAESIRLAINNNIGNSILLLHGDIVFNEETFKNINFNKSFVLIDNQKQILDREVGVTIVDNYATMLSYDLPTKWCQIAYFCDKEYKLLKDICKRDPTKIAYKLFFELINMIIVKNGQFLCIESPEMKIFEIDTMSDLYENTNSK